VGSDWYNMATMQINAYSNKSWTIQAVQPDGSLGTEYTFLKNQAKEKFVTNRFIYTIILFFFSL